MEFTVAGKETAASASCRAVQAPSSCEKEGVDPTFPRGWCRKTKTCATDFIYFITVKTSHSALDLLDFDPSFSYRFNQQATGIQE